MYQVIIKEFRRNWLYSRIRERASETFTEFYDASQFAARYSDRERYIVIFKDLTEYLGGGVVPDDEGAAEWQERLNAVDPNGELDENTRADIAGKSYIDDDLPF